jgi:antitoxin component of RelBE/YafQ-DinJ toxin-antitoxin module
MLPKVYTLGMNKYAVINLKTDPKLKEDASETANKLGVSLSAVLNNELRRFATEKSVVFEIPELPNNRTAEQLLVSQKQINDGDYYKFDNNKKSLEFLAKELK